MSPLAIAGAAVAVWLIVTALVVALCRAAAPGDRQLPELERRRTSQGEPAHIVRPAPSERAGRHVRVRTAATPRRIRG
jgi:hypothetical protein